MNKQNRKKLQRFFVHFFSIFFIISLLLPDVAEGRRAYHLITTVNDDGQGYSAQVIDDSNQSIKNAKGTELKVRFEDIKKVGSMEEFEEGWLEEVNTFAFNPYSQKEGVSSLKAKESSDDEDDEELDEDDEDIEVEKGGRKALAQNPARPIDADRADLIGATLTRELNDFIAFVHGKGNFVTEFGENREEAIVAKGIELSQAIVNYSTNGSAVYGDARLSRPTADEVRPSVDSGSVLNDYVKVTNGRGQQKIFRYQMLKGYNMDGLGEEYDDFHETYKRLTAGYTYKDVTHLNWNMFIAQANRLLVAEGITTNSMEGTEEIGKISKLIVDSVEDFLRGFVNILQMKEIEELIFNAGLRGSEYYYGAFPERFLPTIRIFYVIVLAISLLIVVFGFFKIIVSNSFNTLNVYKRLQIGEDFKNLALAVLLMPLLITGIVYLLQINASLVLMFSEFAPSIHELTYTVSGNIIGALVYQVFVFVVTFRLNFMYLVRMIMISIHIVLSPLFASFITLGGQAKDMLGGYLKDVFGTIFIQSVHAFTITFLLSMFDGATTLEKLIIMYSFFTISDFFRGLIFGTGGGLVNQLGGKATQQATLAGVGMAGTGLAMAKLGKKTYDERRSGSKKGNSSKGFGRADSSKTTGTGSGGIGGKDDDSNHSKIDSSNAIPKQDDKKPQDKKFNNKNKEKDQKTENEKSNNTGQSTSSQSDTSESSSSTSNSGVNTDLDTDSETTEKDTTGSSTTSSTTSSDEQTDTVDMNDKPINTEGIPIDNDSSDNTINTDGTPVRDSTPISVGTSKNKKNKGKINQKFGDVKAKVQKGTDWVQNSNSRLASATAGIGAMATYGASNLGRATANIGHDLAMSDVSGANLSESHLNDVKKKINDVGRNQQDVRDNYTNDTNSNENTIPSSDVPTDTTQTAQPQGSGQSATQTAQPQSSEQGTAQTTTQHNAPVVVQTPPSMTQSYTTQPQQNKQQNKQQSKISIPHRQINKSGVSAVSMDNNVVSVTYIPNESNADYLDDVYNAWNDESRQTPLIDSGIQSVTRTKDGYSINYDKNALNIENVVNTSKGIEIIPMDTSSPVTLHNPINSNPIVERTEDGRPVVENENKK